MTKNIRGLILSIGLVGVLCSGTTAWPMENVAAVRSSANDNWILDSASSYYPPTTNLRPVEVFTAGEINAMVQGLSRRLDSVQNVGALVEQKITAAETRLREGVNNSIEALPQRLVATEAMKEFRNSILVELRTELAQLRLELQKQIDALKRTEGRRP